MFVKRVQFPFLLVKAEDKLLYSNLLWFVRHGAK